MPRIIPCRSGGADLSFGFVLAGTLAISIPCAAISYYLVERPLLRLKYRRLQDVIRGCGGIDSSGAVVIPDGELDDVIEEAHKVEREDAGYMKQIRDERIG